MTRIKSIFMLILLATLFAFAQEETEEMLDFSSMSLEDLLNVEVSVASKNYEDPLEAPSSVTVYTRKEIKNMSVRSVDELMNYVPGFQTARTDEYLQQINAPSVLWHSP